MHQSSWEEAVVKTDIVDFIYKNIGCPRKIAALSVEQILCSIKEALASGENVQVVGFGRFHVRAKKERVGRDPSTGDEITIAARRVLSFKPSRRLKGVITGRRPDQGHLP